MSRVLVTGGTGFLGGYMAEYLASRGAEVAATYFDPPTDRERHRASRFRLVHLDVTDGAEVLDLLEEERPDVVYHFAGQAFIGRSLEAPAETYRTNVWGTLHLLEAIRRSRPRTVLAFAGSGTQYGAADRVPTPEESPPRPGSPYAASKAAADLLCQQYFQSFGLSTFRYRIFGTTGPGKRGDSVNDFASQIARKEQDDLPGPMRVGNLETRRDITDVRDSVAAMVRVVEHGEPGGAYNIGSGEARRVGDILDSLVRLARVRVDLATEPSLLRPVDERVHQADIARLQKLGWSPRIPFDQTLRDVLDGWRATLPLVA